MTRGKKNTGNPDPNLENNDKSELAEGSGAEKSVVMDAKWESILSELAQGMVALQQTVGDLTLQVNKGVAKAATEVDRSYISNWKELGGSNLSFYPNSKTHPQAFLKKLNKIFKEAGVPEQFKTGLATPCLKGAAADWVSVKESSFKSFQEFESAFLNRFWGVDKQRDLFLQLSYGRFESGSRSEYFLHLVNQAGFLSQPIDEIKLIEMLSKHFPTDIQRGILTLGLATFDEVEEYLRKIDETFASEATQNNIPSRQNNNYRRHIPNTRDSPSTSTRTNESRIERNTQPDNGNQTRINYITRFNDDSEIFISDTDSDEESNDCAVPIIKASIHSLETDILLDSGSEITAVSENFYNNICKQTSVPILPVSNVTIAVAVGGKKQRVQHQVLLPIDINGVVIHVQCLVIPNLNRDILFGFDWLKQYKANIYFDKSVLRFYDAENKECIVKFDASLNKDKSLNINLCIKNAEMVNLDSMVERHKYDDIVFKAAVEKANLEGSDKLKLYELLKSYEDIFSGCPGRVKSYEHEIEMRDENPFNCPLYPIPFIYRADVRNQIDEMLAWGVIKKEKTEYISPLVTVKKKDSSVRICLDARHLNEKMKKDYVEFPRGKGDESLLEAVWVLAHERLCTKAERRAAKFNAKIKPVSFATGDKVLVRTHCQSSAEDRTIKKFFLLYEGPFWIARQAGPNSYILENEQGQEFSKQNVVNLKLYKDASLVE